MSNTKHTQPICTKCGVRLMNKEVQYCTSCAGEVNKKLKMKLLALAIGLICIGAAVMYVTEMSNLPNLAKLFIFCFVIFGISALFKIISHKITR